MTTGVSATAMERRLLQELFAEYSPMVRPVEHVTQPTVVKLGAALQQIIDMDEKNQVITVNLWMRMFWIDLNLQWDPAEYGNTSVIIVPIDQIWKPDIVLYTNVDTSSGMVTTNAAVYSDGSVYWNAPAIYTSSCKIDVSYFPFDEQICTLQFGSWAYNGFQVDLTNRSSAGDTSAYIDSGEWELVGMPVVRHVVYYDCCEAPFPDLRFHILIRRRPLFYMFNLLVPCFLISMITALGFYMPADSGEKVTLGITILLALTVFLLLVAETMPPQSEVVPLIGQYYACTIGLVSGSSVMTVYVLSLHYRLPGTKRVPRWMRVFFLKHLAQLMMMGDIQKFLGATDDDDEEECEKSTVLQNNGNSKAQQVVYSLPEMHQQQPENDPAIPTRFEESLTKIVTELKGITGRYQDSDNDETILTEWKYCALVLDRLFLWVFIISTVTCTVSILCQAKPYTTAKDVERMY